MTDKRTLGDRPIEDKYQALMNSLAQYIDRFFNYPNQGSARKTGFVLLTFDFGHDKGRCNYISNAERADIINLLKEQLAYFTKDEPTPPKQEDQIVSLLFRIRNYIAGEQTLDRPKEAMLELIDREMLERTARELKGSDHAQEF